MVLGQDMSILYIEDNSEIRENVSTFLRKHKYKVFSVDSVSSAQNIFSRESIDIVLTDLYLENHNGMDFVRWLRDESNPIPIIITTAFTDKNFLLDAITYDVTRYLVKPFKKSELIDALEIAIKKLSRCMIRTSHKLHRGYRYDADNKAIIDSVGNSIQLSKKEFMLLELLLSHKNQIVTYDMIESTVWKNMPMSIDALRTLIRGMRKKTYKDMIVNLNGMGYKIELE